MPEVSGEADIAFPLGLLTPLHTLSLPVEVGRFLHRYALVTVSDVVALHPTRLPWEKDFGRRNLAALRAAVEQVCGTTWEEAWLQGREGEPVEQVKTAPSAKPRPPETKWTALGLRMSAEKAQQPLATVPGVPTRVLGFAKDRGITTVGQLLALPFAELSAPRALGPLTLRTTLTALSRLARKRGLKPHRDLDRFASLVDLWRAETASLRSVDRQVVRSRSGLDAPAATLQEVATTLKLTPERARQIEARALAEMRISPWWVEPLRARLVRHLGADAVSLDALVQGDPWLAPLHDHPDLFLFVSQHFLGGQFHIVNPGGGVFLARTRQEDFDKAWRRLDQRLATQRWPAPRASLETTIATCGAALGEFGRQWLAARVAPFLNVSPEGPQILGYNSPRQPEIVAWLRARGEPVAVRDLVQQFGRGLWPEEIVYLESAMVALAEQLNGFAALRDVVVPRCVKHMKAHGPGRPWSSAELAAMLGDDPTLLPWFGPAALGSMLQQSPQLRSLGRGMFALAAVEGERIPLRGVILEVLQTAGSSLALDEIERRVMARRGEAAPGVLAALQRPPFVEVAPRHYGLIERDLPGGPDAAAQAVTALLQTLAQHDRGLWLQDALAPLVDQSTFFGRWTTPMLRSVCRHDPRLITSPAGAVGLTAWGNVRAPSRKGVAGKAPSAPAEAVPAEAAPAEAAPAAPPAWPELPAEFVARWEALCAVEDAGEDLGRTVDAHVQGFYINASPRPAFDLTKVLKARRACHALLADAASAPEPFRHAARAAVRFFVRNDNTWDTSPRGLDTSLAVLEAVARHRDDKAPEKAGDAGAKGSKRKPAPR